MLFLWYSISRDYLIETAGIYSIDCISREDTVCYESVDAGGAGLLDQLRGASYSIAGVS